MLLCSNRFAKVVVRNAASSSWRATEMTVDSSQDQMRLDRLLTRHFDLSHSSAHRLIRQHQVIVERPGDSKKVRPSFSALLRTGDVVSLPNLVVAKREAMAPSSAQPVVIEASLQRSVIYRDEHILVINKPRGLASHSGPGIKWSLEDFLDSLRFGSAERPRLVHRLDRHSSGLLILARTLQAAQAISQSLSDARADGPIEKVYWAMCVGKPAVRKGTIISNIYTSLTPHNTERMTVLPQERRDLLDEGKTAITEYRMMSEHVRKVGSKRFKLSLLEFKPRTGRKHQIRVHAAQKLGTPILGDLKYDRHQLTRLPMRPGHLHLHSYRLTIRNYPACLFGKEAASAVTGRILSLVAPIPAHFLRTIDRYPMFLRSRPKFPKRKLKNL